MNLDQLLEAMKRSFLTRRLSPLDEQIAEDAIKACNGGTVEPHTLRTHLRNLGEDLIALAASIKED